MRLSAPPAKVSLIRVVLAGGVLARAAPTGTERTRRAAVPRLGAPLLVERAVVGVRRSVCRLGGSWLRPVRTISPASSVRRLAALATVPVVAITAAVFVGTVVAAGVVDRIDTTVVLDRDVKSRREKGLMAGFIFVSVGGRCGCIDGINASVVRGAECAIAVEIGISRFCQLLTAECIQLVCEALANALR